MSGLTPERETQLVERLHAMWHPAPNGCPRRRPCYERGRAKSVVRVIGPIVAAWLAEDIAQAKASLDREWGVQ